MTNIGSANTNTDSRLCKVYSIDMYFVEDPRDPKRNVEKQYLPNVARSS
jgi:hypothetical protein